MEKWSEKFCSLGCKNNMLSIEKSILKMLNEPKVRKIMNKALNLVDGSDLLELLMKFNKFLLNNKVNV